MSSKNIYQSTLPNGLRVIMEPMKGLRSVSIGVWVNAGSIYEDEKNSGISHFIEHMVFKGTSRRTAQDIAVEMDAIGGNLNAFTAKECTCFYAKVLDEHLPLAVDVLSDLTLHSLFAPKDIEREKSVVLEEISMTEDSPEDKAFESAGSAFFEGTVLERAILGSRETVSAFTREQILAYMQERYTAKNIVVACAGSFDPDGLLALLEKTFRDCPPGEAFLMKEALPRRGKEWLFIQKDTEQVNTCLVLPGFPIGTKEYYAMAVLSNIVGGSMSSRLFQKIREQRGLAYSVYTYPMAYRNVGSLCIYAGSGEEQSPTTLTLILEELSLVLREGITEEEFNRCRDQLKGSFLLGMEGSSAHMNAIGKSLLLQNKEYTLEETLSAIECVTMDKIREILPSVFSPRRAVCAAVGRVEKVKGQMESTLAKWAEEWENGQA